jgi:polyhydroxybutyrate depolymerase
MGCVTDRDRRGRGHFGSALAALGTALSLTGSTLAIFAVSSTGAADASTPTGLHVAARPSPGCVQTTVVTGEETLNFDAVNDDGSYTEQVPTTAAAGKPLPVVFDLHAYEEPGQLQVTLSGLGTYGQTHGFATITPWIDDQPVPLWQSAVGSKDMAWFGKLITHIETTTCVDENRVFVTGYSNGAFMSSAVACQFSSRVAAVAPVAGIMAVSPCKMTRPVPVVAFHGTADPLVHYDGTASKAAEDLPAPDGSGKTIGQEAAESFGTKGVFKKGPSIPQEAGTWARRNGCSTKFTSTRIASDVTLLSWSCPRHANVELFRIQGGGHTWPGSQESAELVKIVGRTTFSISADAEMWSFFMAHPLTRSD